MTNTVNTMSHTDINRLAWIEQQLPKKFRPYAYLARIDRPIGIWLLVLPGWWGIILASGGIFSIESYGLWLMALFGIGAIIMRSAGCVINDLWDKDIDKNVERTKNRPLASQELNTQQAAIFLGILLFLGFLILWQLNRTTFVLGLLVVPLIIIYPYMKRITWWPQLFLGLTFNFGALMGWSAITGSLSFSALLLYIAGVFWTLGYDTIYAHQDKEDDATIGMKSTAILFGDDAKKWVTKFYELSTVCLFFAVLLSSGSLISALLVLLASSHLLWQLTDWEPDNAKNTLEIFKANKTFGLLVLLMLCLG